MIRKDFQIGKISNGPTTHPRDRFAFAVFLRDLSFSAGAMACALAQARQWSPRTRSWMTTIVRYAMAVPIIAFGVEHFLFPEFVPIVPLRQPMPAWIPGHFPLAYVTGAFLLASGACIAFNWRARRAATWLGVFVFAIVMFVYLPMMAAKLSDIGNGLNYFADTLMVSGGALLLAGALPGEEQVQVAQANGGGSAVGLSPGEAT